MSYTITDKHQRMTIMNLQTRPGHKNRAGSARKLSRSLGQNENETNESGVYYDRLKKQKPKHVIYSEPTQRMALICEMSAE